MHVYIYIRMYFVLIIRSCTCKKRKKKFKKKEVLIARLECYGLDKITLTLFRMGYFGTANGWGGGDKKVRLPKICQTCPKIMKLWWTLLLYPKKIQKYINHGTYLFSSAFFTGNQQLLLHREIHIQIAF